MNLFPNVAYPFKLFIGKLSIGYKPEGITYPSGAMQQRLLSEFYDEVKVDPSTLAYVEAHSTGTIVGDPEGIQLAIPIHKMEN